MILRTRNRIVSFPRRPLLMGIVNVNDDSFSGDGTLDIGQALARAKSMVRLGADIIDVGGESARTNRGPISEQEEIDRVVPFIRGFLSMVEAGDLATRDAAQLSPPLLSINTWRTGVARVALREGGDLLNDIGGLPDDANARVCAKTGAALLIMHSIGQPKVPHTHVQYPSVLESVESFFEKKLALATASGLSFDSTILDPGIDFAKQREDNLRILAFGDRFTRLGRPLLWPISRKTVIGETLGISDASQRDAGTVSCLQAGIKRGASIFRVHNLEAAFAANRVLWEIENSKS